MQRAEANAKKMPNQMLCVKCVAVRVGNTRAEKVGQRNARNMRNVDLVRMEINENQNK